MQSCYPFSTFPILTCPLWWRHQNFTPCSEYKWTVNLQSGMMIFSTLFSLPLLSTHNVWCASLFFSATTEWWFDVSVGISVITSRPYSWEGSWGLSEPICAWSKVQVLTWYLTGGIGLKVVSAQKWNDLTEVVLKHSPVARREIRKWFILHWDLLSQVLNCPLCLPVDF